MSAAPSSAAPGAYWKRSTALLLAICLLQLLAPVAARAHAFLRHARPAVGGTVTTAPVEVRIDFTSALEPLFSAIAVTNEAGASVDNGDSHPEGGSSLAVGLKPLPPGHYQVRWHVVSVDTHRTEGSFAFTVAPPG